MKKAILFAALCCLVLLSIGSNAEAVSFGLDFEYSGAFDPQGEKPWLTATFDDVLTNEVQLKMDATKLVGSEFVSGWYFNLDDSINPLNLSFTYDGNASEGGPEADSISTSQNGLSAGPASGFDLAFNFKTSNSNGGASRFGAGETVVYSIIFNDPDPNDTIILNAQSFDFKNAGGNFLSAAHVQGIGPSGENSGWIAATSTTDIPEAASLLSLGLGILGIGLVARKKRLR